MAGLHALSARDRLILNRERLAGWLEQDRRAQAERPSGGWLAGAAWPVLKGLGVPQAASLALGSLVRSWSRSSPAVPVVETMAAGATLAWVRRHPRTSAAAVAVVGLAWLWRHRHQRPS